MIPAPFGTSRSKSVSHASNRHGQLLHTRTIDMSAATRLVDTTVLLFWLAHIPVTVFIDSQAGTLVCPRLPRLCDAPPPADRCLQILPANGASEHLPARIAVFPAAWYPRWATSINASYLQKLGDPLVRRR